MRSEWAGGGGGEVGFFGRGEGGGSSITKGGGTFRINEETVIGAEGRKTKRLRERDS